MTNQDTPLQPQEEHRRISTIVHRIQSFVSVRWEGRNISLHKSEQHEEARQQTLEAAEIRHYFNQPHLIPASDQHYCSRSLTKLLRSQPAYRRRWLRRVRQARADMLNDQSRQALITTYFTRIRTAVTPAKPPGTGTYDTLPMGNIPNTTTSGIQRSTTHRAKITHFFPGRPPDPTFTGQFHHQPKSPA
jgi:hypothetical protein